MPPLPATSIFKQIADFARRPLVANLIKVSTGNLAGNALNFAALALLSTALDPGPRGIFTAMQAAMILLASLTDFGLNTTIIKFYGDLASGGNKPAAEALMRRLFYYRLVITGCIAGGCMIFARPICRAWLGDESAVDLFRLSCVGALGSSVWMYSQAAMQARSQFTAYALLTVANHALRLILFVAVILLGRMDVGPAVIIIMAVPFVGAAGASLLSPPEFWRANMPKAQINSKIAEIFQFSKWIFFSTVIVSLIMQLDKLMLSGLSDEAQVGQFGNAHDLAQGFPLLAAALSTVLLPRLASTRRRDEIVRIMRFGLRALPLLVAAAAAAMALAHWLIPYIRGGAYTPSIILFDLLVVGFTISVLVNPLSFFCLAFERANWLTWMNLMQLALSLALNFLLIPRFGALGAAVASLAVRLFALLFLGIAFRRLLAIAEA